LLVLTLVAAASCGDDDDATGDTSEQSAKKVATALTSNVLFADGVVELGELPDQSNDTVSLKQEDQVLSLQPDEAQILALEVDNPDEDTDPVAATLMQFEGDDDHHIEVPGGQGDADAGADAGTGGIALKFTVGSDVCSKLCDDTFTITMLQAVRLKKGGVSKHLKRTIHLDCSKKGDHSLCPKSSEPSKPSGSAGKTGSTKDAGTSSGGNGGSGSGPSAEATTNAGEFSRALTNANNALCNKCMPFKKTPCAAMLPADAVSCVKDVVEANYDSAASSAILGTINVKLADMQAACTSCDYTMCDPNYFANAIEMLPQEVQDALNQCATDAGGMIGSSYDAGLAP
jgi:hypothetical protein